MQPCDPVASGLPNPLVFGRSSQQLKAAVPINQQLSSGSPDLFLIFCSMISPLNCLILRKI
jgi:hypothetical protein